MANELVVRKCRRCGKEFEQRLRPKLNTISASAEGYVLHSYCEHCRSVNRERFRACDPRYAGVGGHGTDLPSSLAVLRKRKDS